MTDIILLAVIFIAAGFIFGNMLFNPGYNHKPTVTQDKTGAVVVKTVNWDMMRR